MLCSVPIWQRDVRGVTKCAVEFRQFPIRFFLEISILVHQNKFQWFQKVTSKKKKKKNLSPSILSFPHPLFVSPELSSGRELVIQMSVRRAPSAVHVFLSGAYLGNRMTYLDDIWYVGGSRSEVAHAEFWAWQMPIKYLICIIYAKTCPEHFSGTVCPTWMIFGMWVGLGPKVHMVTLMEVKGHQRSNKVNYVLWLPYLVKRSPDAS